MHGPYYLLMHFVIAVAGRSELALRLPSLLAMCGTVALTAAVARRLARTSAVPAAEAVGLLAGLILVTVPLTTRYAQEARPYALASLCAVLASYLLIRASVSPRWGWWAGYAGALIMTGAFNLFAVLIAAAHAISLARLAAADRAPRRSAIVRWATACVVSAVLLAPMIVAAAAQSAQLSWVTRPDASTVASLIRDFAGAAVLIPVVLVLVAAGCLAGTGLRQRTELGLPMLALPWLVVPPVLLLAVSFADPVYVERYVVFCLPALSMLVAAGAIGLAYRVASAWPDHRWLAPGVAGLIGVALVAGAVSPQIQVRAPGSRPDNLRAVAAVLAAHERPRGRAALPAVEHAHGGGGLPGAVRPAARPRARDRSGRVRNLARRAGDADGSRDQVARRYPDLGGALDGAASLRGRADADRSLCARADWPAAADPALADRFGTSLPCTLGLDPCELIVAKPAHHLMA